MDWRLKDSGDFVERNAYEFISNNIPSYEEIWKRLIGHRGDGVIANATGLTNEADVIRKKFAEHHYTMMHSLVISDFTVKEEERGFIKIGYQAYIKMMRNVDAFWNAAGKAKDNLRECFYLMGYSKTAGDPTESLKLFYEQRSVFIHEKRPPLFIDDTGMYLIAEPASQENIDGWSNKLTWEEAKELKRDYVCDSLSRVAKRIYPQINALLAKLLGLVKDFIEENRIVLSTPKEQPHLELLINQQLSPPPSGSTFVPVHFLIPSGTTATSRRF